VHGPITIGTLTDDSGLLLITRTTIVSHFFLPLRFKTCLVFIVSLPSRLLYLVALLSLIDSL